MTCCGSTSVMAPLIEEVDRAAVRLLNQFPLALTFNVDWRDPPATTVTAGGQLKGQSE
jgi:hypothetical protein